MVKSFAVSLSLLVYLTVFSSIQRPSVVRVTSTEKNQVSLGSGTCIATANNQTLIITANHVIAGGKTFTISEKPAKLIGTDSTWDIAALVVDETLPTAQLGSRVPQIGEFLTVCGYGGGEYKEATGKVVGFFAPASPDWVAINASARSGDSGGPLFYATGTVAAVLFGSDATGAHGTHCVQVRQFLGTIKGYEHLIKALDNPYNIW